MPKRLRKSQVEGASRRRRVRPGYPVPPQPMSVAEADAYLAEEPLRCLLCGRTMKALASHLAAIHALAGDAYRELYGLPYSVGLTAPSTRQRLAEATTARLLAPPRRKGRKAALPLVFKPLALRGKERISHYRRLRAIERLSDYTGLPRGFAFGREHLQRFLARAATGRTFNEVASDPDMPSISWVETACRQWPALYRDFERTVELLPFAVQARIRRLGPRFAAAVVELHRRGLSLRAIATRLGVTEMTVHRRLARQRRTERAEP